MIDDCVDNDKEEEDDDDDDDDDKDKDGEDDYDKDDKDDDDRDHEKDEDDGRDDDIYDDDDSRVFHDIIKLSHAAQELDLISLLVSEPYTVNRGVYASFYKPHPLNIEKPLTVPCDSKQFSWFYCSLNTFIHRRKD
jgi:hypothetical protein